jgi:hypothetical protein
MSAPTFAPPPEEPSPSPIHRTFSKAAVQVAASEAEGDARDAGAKARRLTSQGEALSITVVKASVGGRTVYRAMLHNFPARADAFKTCEALKARGQACFVRESY